jgi:hypothetical protein
MRAGVGVVSFFAIGPLSGAAACSLWNAWGNSRRDPRVDIGSASSD